MHKIAHELKTHVPFTILGALTGIALMVLIVKADVPRSVSEVSFGVLHPTHVLLSALVTTGMFKLHSKGRLLSMILIGYIGSIGIATLSDCIIPYLGELLLDMPHSHLHLGFIEKWWLVNPLACVGIAIAYYWPKTKFPHAGHVLLSTWASLFHMTMAIGTNLNVATILIM
ncbi:MAG: hypothetical protein J7M40_02450, partial [Planctomycetes bacterium]|nr:hypothetical protein [Planctomycetota bacterium]